MFYFLTVLTFLVTILFYSFYPRSDGFKIMDKPTARSAAMEIVNQHSAALQAASVLKDNADGTRSMVYEAWGNGNVAATNFNRYKVAGTSEISMAGLNSKIVCTDNTNGTQTATCGTNTTDFLITYISIDDLAGTYGDYTANLAPRALGEATHLTSYTDEAHLTTNCGILVQYDNPANSPVIASNKDFDPNNANVVLDNTRYETVSMPYAFTNTLTLDDGYLACITRLSATYDEDGNIIYPSAPTP